jgi:hypothetical protein
MGAKGPVSGKGLRHMQHCYLSSSYYDMSSEVSDAFIRHVFFLQRNHGDNSE